MTHITVAPASPESWPDVEHALTGGGDGASCWCQWFRMSSREFDASSREDRRSHLREEVELGDRPPGLLAHVDGEAAGWCRVGPRGDQPRLVRSRIVRVAGGQPLDDSGVWAVTCFVVRREFRGQGVARLLAQEAVAFARARGASRLEAYPVDVEAREARGTRTGSNELYHGDIGIFRSAGFTLTARPTPTRAVMTLDLRDS